MQRQEETDDFSTKIVSESYRIIGYDYGAELDQLIECRPGHPKHKDRY